MKAIVFEKCGPPDILELKDILKAAPLLPDLPPGYINPNSQSWGLMWRESLKPRKRFDISKPDTSVVK